MANISSIKSMVQSVTAGICAILAFKVSIDTLGLSKEAHEQDLSDEELEEVDE